MPRCGVPVRQDGTNVATGCFFSRLTLRPATGTAQRAFPTLIVCERHNPKNIYPTAKPLSAFCPKKLADQAAWRTRMPLELNPRFQLQRRVRFPPSHTLIDEPQAEEALGRCDRVVGEGEGGAGAG